MGPLKGGYVNARKFYHPHISKVKGVYMRHSCLDIRNAIEWALKSPKIRTITIEVDRGVSRIFASDILNSVFLIVEPGQEIDLDAEKKRREEMSNV